MCTGTSSSCIDSWCPPGDESEDCLYLNVFGKSCIPLILHIIIMMIIIWVSTEQIAIELNFQIMKNSLRIKENLRIWSDYRPARV